MDGKFVALLALGLHEYILFIYIIYILSYTIVSPIFIKLGFVGTAEALPEVFPRLHPDKGGTDEAQMLVLVVVLAGWCKEPNSES